MHGLFEILNPLGQGRTPITGQLERLSKCNSTQPSQPVEELDQPILAVVIGTSALFLVLVSAVVIYRKCCKKTGLFPDP